MYISELQNQVTTWNEQNKCGFSWEFSAPLFLNKINTVQVENTSAVQVMLIWQGQLLYEGGLNYNQFGLVTSTNTSSDNFELYFLLPSYLDENNYNEIKGHPVDESRSIELERLLSCLRGDNTNSGAMLDLCNTFDGKYKLSKWNVFAVNENFLDNNYIGFRVQISLQKLNL
ncbi:hypothetical protein [Empedobacter sp. 189-2]|uniref:hypothetical protein n=1 Tax=Empedobacter sp. 189-2 TaxID=2746724 RepID=UPI0025765729|nr:hypothetical protein [Empedobacter sp. 189-2]MDM1542353.1 hypothetical protein [Empedobacter sp. 189-2]